METFLIEIGTDIGLYTPPCIYVIYTVTYVTLRATGNGAIIAVKGGKRTIL